LHSGGDEGVGFGAGHGVGQRAGVHACILDGKGLFDDAALFIGRVEVDRVARHGEGELLAGGKYLLPDVGHVLIGSGVDVDVVGLAEGNSLGDCGEDVGIGDLLDLGLVGRAALGQDQFEILVLGHFLFLGYGPLIGSRGG